MMGIEKEIRQLIDEAVCGKYIGKLKVSQDGDLWALALYLDMESSPIIMAYQGTVDQFKDFIKTEIKSRKLEEVQFWRAERVPRDNEIKEDDE